MIDQVKEDFVPWITCIKNNFPEKPSLSLLLQEHHLRQSQFVSAKNIFGKTMLGAHNKKKLKRPYEVSTAGDNATTYKQAQNYYNRKNRSNRSSVISFHHRKMPPQL